MSDKAQRDVAAATGARFGGTFSWIPFLLLMARLEFAGAAEPQCRSSWERTQRRRGLMRIEADQLCVDYNGTVALYDASLQPPQLHLRTGGDEWSRQVHIVQGPDRFCAPVTRADSDQWPQYPRGPASAVGGLCAAERRGGQSIPVSVWDVVMMGRYGAMNPFRIPRTSDRVAVRDALERVDMVSLRHQPISCLSGGQRKRTFLARAIAQRADVLLLDEPFNGVDVRTEKLMAQLFLQFREKGCTILISTHDLSHVRDFCDLVVLINKTVLAYGETSEVFTPENIAMTFGGLPPDLLTGNSSPEESG